MAAPGRQSTVLADKAALRARVRGHRARRAASDPPDWRVAAAGIARAAAGVPELAAATTVAGHVAVSGEPPTGPLLALLLRSGRRVLLPVLTTEGGLDWAEYTGAGRLVTGRFGLREPAGPRLGPAALAEATVAFVPALAVDRAGHRLGRGGGHYDRALAGAPDLRVYALLWPEEVVDTLPVEAHDVPVHGVVQPGGLVLLR